MPKSAAAEKKTTRKEPKSKDKILDAAESLFAERGYYGVSTREITQLAGVPLALVSYHFGSKEEMFRSVIERRAQANGDSMRASLAKAIQDAGNTTPPIETVLRAFIEPFVHHAVFGGDGWRNYIRLLAQVANLPQSESVVTPVTKNYDNIVREFIEQAHKALPGMTRENLNWSFYFYQAAIVHILVGSGIIDRQSNGECKSSDLLTIVEKLTKFCAAGFIGMAQEG